MRPASLLAAAALPPPGSAARRPHLVVAHCDEKTSYACGAAIGRQVRRIVTERMAQPDQADLLRWVHGDGAETLRALRAANEAAHPELCDEVRGTADGVGVPYDDLLAVNLQQELEELWGMTGTNPRRTADGCPLPGAGIPGCTDLHLIDHARGLALMAHTEDWTLDIEGYIVVARVESTGSEYAAFAYPGTLPGWAWGFNRHGVVLSMNTLIPKHGAIGKGLVFTARAALDADSIDTAAAVFATGGMSSGQSMNIGAVAEPHRQANVEVSPRGSALVDLSGPRAWWYHTNVFIHLEPELGSNVSCPDGSSHTRLRRLDHIPRPRSELDVRRAISNTDDADYPIYRNQSAPDCCVTLNSVVFDFISGRAALWVFFNPGQEWAYRPTAAETAATTSFHLRGGYHSWLRDARAQ